MHHFKPGDRVAAYDIRPDYHFPKENDGKVKWDYIPERKIGTIKSVEDDVLIVICEEDEPYEGDTTAYHVKQCRKLVKK